MNPGAVTTGSLDRTLYYLLLCIVRFHTLVLICNFYFLFLFSLDSFHLQSSLSRGVCRRSGLDRSPKCRHFGVPGGFRGARGARARARVHTKKCIFRCNFGHPPQLVRKGGPPKSGPPRARAPPGPPGGPPGPPKRAPRGTPPGTPKTDPRGQNIPPSPEPFRFPLSSSGR